jgi:hypothetical protein
MVVLLMHLRCPFFSKPSGEFSHGCHLLLGFWHVPTVLTVRDPVCCCGCRRSSECRTDKLRKFSVSKNNRISWDSPAGVCQIKTIIKAWDERAHTLYHGAENKNQKRQKNNNLATRAASLQAPRMHHEHWRCPSSVVVEF